MRTPTEVGQIVRLRREARGLTQEGCGISSSLVKQIEGGTAPMQGRGAKRSTFMRALGWPPDALVRIAHGDDPATFDAGEPPSTEAPPWAGAMLSGLEAVRVEVRRIADHLEEGEDR